MLSATLARRRIGAFAPPLQRVAFVAPKLSISLSVTRCAFSTGRASAASAVRPPKTLPSFSMQGKTCLVTGAARGLGYEFCRAYVESGCTALALVDYKQEDAQEAAQELRTSYERNDLGVDENELNVVGFGCDVASEAAVKSTFDDVVSRFGRIDAVAASAGICEHYPALDYPADRLRRLFETNVHGAFFTAREAARRMIPAGGGAIVIVSSMSASIVNAPQLQAPYNASKAAAKHFAESLAVEWAEKGVRVNSLSPGYMRTKMTGCVLAQDKDLISAWESRTPMKRMGEPEELSGAIVFLSSDASRFVTGAELRVDGGYCLI